MKRIFLFLAMAVMVSASSAQTLTQRKVIASYSLGVVKLVEIVQRNDTVYAMFLKTGNRYYEEVTVYLGHRDNALRLLNLLNEVKLGNNDILHLDNETNDAVTRGLFGSLRFYSPGRQYSADVGKNYIRKMIGVLGGKPADEEPEPEYEEEQRDYD